MSTSEPVRYQYVKLNHLGPEQTRAWWEASGVLYFGDFNKGATFEEIFRNKVAHLEKINGKLCQYALGALRAELGRQLCLLVEVGLFRKIGHPTKGEYAEASRLTMLNGTQYALSQTDKGTWSPVRRDPKDHRPTPPVTYDGHYRNGLWHEYGV